MQNDTICTEAEKIKQKRMGKLTRLSLVYSSLFTKATCFGSSRDLKVQEQMQAIKTGCFINLLFFATCL